jgi:hypothetical protein
MAAPRKWSDEQVADVVRRHVQGESARHIGKAVGREGSVVLRLLKAPDVAARVATELRAVHAAEAETTAAVKRDASASRRKEARAARGPRQTKQPTGKPSTGKSKSQVLDADTGQMRDFDGGKILSVITFPSGPHGASLDPQAHVVYSRYNKDAADGSGHAAHLARKDREADLEINSDVRVMFPDGALTSFSWLDLADVARVVDYAREYFPDAPECEGTRDEMLRDFANCRHDIDLRTTEPELSHAEADRYDPRADEAAHGVEPDEPERCDGCGMLLDPPGMICDCRLRPDPAVPLLHTFDHAAS